MTVSAKTFWVKESRAVEALCMSVGGPGAVVLCARSEGDKEDSRSGSMRPFVMIGRMPREIVRISLSASVDSIELVAPAVSLRLGQIVSGILHHA